MTKVVAPYGVIPVVASVEETLNHLHAMFSSNKKTFFTRFGDGPFEIIHGNNDSSHQFSEELKTEMKMALSINDRRYIKAASLGYPEEPGMKKRVFVEGSTSGKWPDRYIKTALKYSPDKFYHNPIVFHYLSVFKPDLFKNFVNKHIKPKTKMFIGACDKKNLELFYGPIDHVIKTPEKNAYYSLDWEYILEMTKRVNMVLLACGIAAKAISQRLWRKEINVQLIDLGGVNNILENRNKPAWIKVIGLETLRKNLGIEKKEKQIVDKHQFIKKSLKIKDGYMRPYVGKRQKQNRAMMYRIFNHFEYKRGVEIGVFQGNNAFEICNSIPGINLTCVDPWKKMFHYSQQRMNQFFKETKNKLKNYNVEFIRKTSIEAAAYIPDNSVDFVHIDGRHDFDNAMMDLITWVPKVKSGGAISGHDFFFDGGVGVIQAVTAYTQAHSVDKVYIINDTKCKPSFFWIK